MSFDSSLIHQSFDRIASWMTVPPDASSKGRYLWVMETKTRVISWKNRQAYHFWQNNETAHLQAIFKEMVSQLPSSLQALNENHFHLLIRLRQRSTSCYQRFLKSHNTILGIIYKIIFARSLSSNFQNLQNALDHILYTSLSNLDISKLTPHDIEQIATLIEQRENIPLLKIDWGALALDQFKAAYRLKPYATAPSLDSLSKEQISSLLSANENEIQHFELSEIERNLSKIEPQFLPNLDVTKARRLNLSLLSAEQLLELCLAEKLPHTNYSLINLTQLSTTNLTSALQKNPLIIQQFSPSTVAANLSKFDLKELENLTKTQVAAIDFSQLTGDQFCHLSRHTYSMDQVKLLNLSKFTSSNISEMLRRTPTILFVLSPQTVADNLFKFDVPYLTNLTKLQVAALNFSQLTADQLIHLPLHEIKDSQFKQIDLGNFSAGSIAKIFQNVPLIISKLSPSTIVANLTRIDKRYFVFFSDLQLNEIDYNSLTTDQKSAFSLLQQRKMKNYPKDKPDPLRREHSQNFEHWGNDFFFQRDPFTRNPFTTEFFQTSSNSKKGFSSKPKESRFSGNFEHFGNDFFFNGNDFFSDDFFSNFFADFGFPNVGRQKRGSSFRFAEQPGFRFHESQESNAKQEEALKAYYTNLDSAWGEIKKLNQTHSNPLYENLRKKVLTKKEEMKKHPELTFKDDLKSFQLDHLKSEYKKLALAVHPDKNSSCKDEATQLFNVVNSAFKALSKEKE